MRNSRDEWKRLVSCRTLANVSCESYCAVLNPKLVDLVDHLKPFDPAPLFSSVTSCRTSQIERMSQHDGFGATHAVRPSVAFLKSAKKP